MGQWGWGERNDFFGYEERLMRAVGLYRYLPIGDEESLQDLECDRPVPNGRDLLVAVRAISVNPVDTKVRAPKDKIGNTVEESPLVLGWDAAGVVVEAGDDVTGFKVGDEVYYAGDITRPESNAEFQLVDERIVGRKPSSLSFEESAAMPLTTITAWEALFDRLKVDQTEAAVDKTILIVGGAGGVGSIAIQLAKRVANLTVIATASRSETRKWCQQMGADVGVNHRNNLAEEVIQAGYESVDTILCLNDTDGHWEAMTNAIKPQGSICCVVENRQPLNMSLLKRKSVGLVWELMFTRSMYQTEDMAKQQTLLNEVSRLIDEKIIKTTCNHVVSPINAKNLRTVHGQIEAGHTIGKTVLANWHK